MLGENEKWYNHIVCPPTLIFTAILLGVSAAHVVEQTVVQSRAVSSQ